MAYTNKKCNAKEKLGEAELGDYVNSEISEFKVSIEVLRLSMHGSFFCLLLIGFTLTHTHAGGIPDDNIIKRNFGYNSMCLYFDYHPIPYVSPALYNIVVLLTFCYAYSSGMRVWIAWTTNKISKKQRDHS